MRNRCMTRIARAVDRVLSYRRIGRSNLPSLISATTLHDVIQSYGLWVLFAGVMLESTGVPLPGETILITIALYASATHEIGITAIILVASTAAILGDNLGYMIGRWIGLRLLVRYGPYVRLHEGRVIVGQYLFLRHGGKIVFFGRFVAFLRTFAALLAGANHMPWQRFFVMNALGGLCWAVLIGGGAYVVGDGIRAISGPLGVVLLVLAVTVLVAGLVFVRRNEAEIEVRARAALAPQHTNRNSCAGQVRSDHNGNQV